MIPMSKKTPTQLDLEIKAALEERDQPSYVPAGDRPYHGPSEDYPRRCNLCQGDPDKPYRRLRDGKIVEGCISATHTGHIHGASLKWHNRPAAKQLRKEARERMKAMTAVPNWYGR